MYKIEEKTKTIHILRGLMCSYGCMCMRACSFLCVYLCYCIYI